jgi:hypothetical protein
MRRGGERWDNTAIVTAQMVTMGLCGLWHGAGWSFVVWGLLHGILLVAYDGWGSAKKRLGLVGRLPAPVAEALARATLLAFLAATFVIFRADDLGVAGDMLRTMSGTDGVFLAGTVPRLASTIGLEGALMLVTLLAIVWYAPGSHEILGNDRPALDFERFVRTPLRAAWRWRPTPVWAVAGLACLLPAVYWILIEGYEEFIYRFF